MGNLYGKFKVNFLNFYGVLNKEAGIIEYADLISVNCEAIKMLEIEELKKVFDNFYGGSIDKLDNSFVIIDIPVRILYFETGGVSEILAIGHVQEDSWLCSTQEEIVTEEFIVKECVNTYLKKLMDKFPHSLDKFMHIFLSNPYEMCEILDLKNINPLEFEKVFKQTFIKILESTN